MAEQWLSIVEYARTYRISDMTVRRHIKNGRLRAVLREGKYFIPVGEVPPMAAGPEATNPDVKETPTSDGRFHGATGMQPPNRVNPLTAVVGQRVPPARSPADFRVEASARLVEGGVIPGVLRAPLAASETSLVDSRALLAYCEASLRKLADSERRTIDRFKSKLEAVESQLVARDLEIKSLKQQVEDLQLLVKVLERRGTV